MERRRMRFACNRCLQFTTATHQEDCIRLDPTTAQYVLIAELRREQFELFRSR